MILDTSAIVALLFKEPTWQVILDALEQADVLGVGAPTLAETAIVVGLRRGFDHPHVPRFVQEFGVQTISFGSEHWGEAVRAYERYGKGRHAARLNFGDCLAYATAKLAAQPLLYIGEDFPKTDLELVRIDANR